METIKINTVDNWMVEAISNVWNYTNKRRYRNWFAIVTRDENGMEKRSYMKESRNEDEYFNVSKVNVGDILMAGCYDERKNRGIKHSYYAVVAKSNDSITLVSETTYLKAKKCFA